MHGNTYGVSGDSIRIDPAFTDGTDCAISEDIGTIGVATGLKMTRTSKTVAHISVPVAEFVFEFPELLLPAIEEIEYSFTAASETEPWVQHRALTGNDTTVPSIRIQLSEPARGTVTVRVAQAVRGLPRAPDHWMNALSGLCLDTDGHLTLDGTTVNVWTCMKGAENEGFVLDKAGHFVGQNSKKCLSMHGCMEGSGACIQSCDKVGTSLWEISAETNGHQSIHPKGERDMCLKADSKTLSSQVSVGACDSNSSLWVVV